MQTFLFLRENAKFHFYNHTLNVFGYIFSNFNQGPVQHYKKYVGKYKIHVSLLNIYKRWGLNLHVTLCQDPPPPPSLSTLLTRNLAKHTRMNQNIRKIIKTINTSRILCQPVRPVMQNLALTYHVELGRDPVGAQGTRVALRSVRPLRTPQTSSRYRKNINQGLEKVRV